MSKKPWRAADCVQWTLERPEGDIEVFARNHKEAIECISQTFSKLNTLSFKLKRTDKTLIEHLNNPDDNLKKEGIS